MLGEDLSNALSGIADDKIESAMNAYARRKARVRQGWLRVAAVAATLAILLTAALWPAETEEGFITAPGVMKVYAYDLTSGTDFSQLEYTELKEGMELPYKYGWSNGISWQPGLPLTLSMPNDVFINADITFEIALSGGEFFATEGTQHQYLGRSFVVENNQTIRWWNMITFPEFWDENYEHASPDSSEIDCFLEGKAYVDIIIRADDHIVGCMTVMIYSEDITLPAGSAEYLGSRYFAKLIGSIYCPKQNGKYQNVNRGQMVELMDSWK